MFGNIVSDAEILQLRRSTDIYIHPFDPDRMRLAHYALSAGSVVRLQSTHEELHATRQLHDFSIKPTYAFRPNEYLLVEVAEQIHLKPGIVGNFVPASDLIEQGFGLTAGKIDPGFGQLQGEIQKVRFGVKNLLDVENVLDCRSGLAHVFFMNLRGLRTRDRSFTSEEKRKLAQRHDPRYLRADDDGVRYPDDEDY